MPLNLRVEIKRHKNPLSRPEALQENHAEACFWKIQDKAAQIYVPFNKHAGQFISAFCHCPWRHESLDFESADLHHRPHMATLINWWRKLMHCRCLAAMTGRVQVV